jgi:hypothetical protein
MGILSFPFSILYCTHFLSFCCSLVQFSLCCHHLLLCRVSCAISHALFLSSFFLLFLSDLKQTEIRSIPLLLVVLQVNQISPSSSSSSTSFLTLTAKTFCFFFTGMTSPSSSSPSSSTPSLSPPSTSSLASSSSAALFLPFPFPFPLALPLSFAEAAALGFLTPVLVPVPDFLAVVAVEEEEEAVDSFFSWSLTARRVGVSPSWSEAVLLRMRMLVSFSFY